MIPGSLERAARRSYERARWKRAITVGLCTSPVAIVCCMLSPCRILSVPVCIATWCVVVVALWRGGRVGGGAAAGLVAGSVVFACMLGMQTCGVSGCGLECLLGCAIAAAAATTWAMGSTRGMAGVVALALAACVSFNGCMLMGFESALALAVGAAVGALLYRPSRRRGRD